MKKTHDDNDEQKMPETVEEDSTPQTDESNRLEELEANLRRALADYQNLQRRVAEEKIAIGKFATQALLMDLLPIIDQLDVAVTTAPDEDKKSGWFQAVHMSVGQIKELLKREGVEEINPEGHDFNGEEHEVVDVVEGEKDNKVTRVHQKGYKMHERVIRPARVQVSKKS